MRKIFVKRKWQDKRRVANCKSGCIDKQVAPA